MYLHPKHTAKRTPHLIKVYQVSRGMAIDPVLIPLADGGQAESSPGRRSLSSARHAGTAYLALTFLTTGRFSDCCFSLNGIFYHELSRSIIDKGLLATTPFASGLFIAA